VGSATKEGTNYLTGPIPELRRRVLSMTQCERFLEAFKAQRIIGQATSGWPLITRFSDSDFETAGLSTERQLLVALLVDYAMRYQIPHRDHHGFSALRYEPETSIPWHHDGTAGWAVSLSVNLSKMTSTLELLIDSEQGQSSHSYWNQRQGDAAFFDGNVKHRIRIGPGEKRISLAGWLKKADYEGG